MTRNSLPRRFFLFARFLLPSFFLLLCILSLWGCADSQEKASGARTLVLATLFDDPALTKAAAAFHKNYPDYTVEIKNYAGEALELRDAINTIKMEIASGAGPDLVNFGLYYSAGDASGKILEDLTACMEKDPDFQQKDYFYNIWNSFADESGLHILVPSFGVNTFATSAPELADRDGWTVEEMTACFEKCPEGTVLFPGETKTAVFGTLCTGSMENYVDWNSGTCSFDSESFQALLSFSDRFPLKLVLSEDASIREEFSEGRALLYPVSIDSVFVPSQVAALLGRANYIGYPMDQGSGSMAEINDIAIGIGKNCKDKTAAWNFMKELLSEDAQREITNGLPVSRLVLQAQLEAAKEPEILEDGERAVKETLLFEGEDPLPICQITQEDADTLLTLLNKVRYNSSLDRDLYNIILEEADFFFHKERSVEDTVEIIQRRASVLISEKM